eukprot:524378-Hanusia_phi.AAC.6
MRDGGIVLPKERCCPLVGEELLPYVFEEIVVVEHQDVDGSVCLHPVLQLEVAVGVEASMEGASSMDEERTYWADASFRVFTCKRVPPHEEVVSLRPLDPVLVRKPSGQCAEHIAREEALLLCACDLPPCDPLLLSDVSRPSCRRRQGRSEPWSEPVDGYLPQQGRDRDRQESFIHVLVLHVQPKDRRLCPQRHLAGGSTSREREDRIAQVLGPEEEGGRLVLRAREDGDVEEEVAGFAATCTRVPLIIHVEVDGIVELASPSQVDRSLVLEFRQSSLEGNKGARRRSIRRQAGGRALERSKETESREVAKNKAEEEQGCMGEEVVEERAGGEWKEEGGGFESRSTWITSSFPSTKIRFPLSVEVCRGLERFTCKEPKEGEGLLTTMRGSTA